MNIHTLLEQDILSRLEFENEEEQMDFLSQISQILFTRIIDRVSDILTQEEQQSLIKLFDTDAEPEQVMAALDKAVPYFYTLVGQEVVELKYEILEQVGIISDAVTT